MRLLFEKSKAFPLQEILLASTLVVVIVIIARFAWVPPPSTCLASSVSST